MKKRFIVLTMLLSMLMILSSFSSVFAAEGDEGDAQKKYNYTITVYSGRHGHFTDGSKVKEITAKAGEEVNINYDVVLNNNEEDQKYYVRGFRETGHDNDEQMSALAFKADEDASYEVAYGIKGGMVKYTVMYVDAQGDELVNSNEYYGMVGDKPVVSYHYIDGYQPNAYNLTKRLVADESKNVFAFSYLPLPEGAEPTADNTAGNNGQAGARNAANGQNNANANANANGNAAANDANANGPATIIDLDDNATPQAENAGGGTTDIADSDAPKAGLNPLTIGGIIALIAAIVAAIAAAVIRRRNSEYEDDDEEENYNRSKSIYSDQE